MHTHIIYKQHRVGMISSKGAQQIETLWMSDRQGLVPVTMANKPAEIISKLEREEETATYSVGTTLRTLHMQKQTKTQNTEREKVRVKLNRSIKAIRKKIK